MVSGVDELIEVEASVRLAVRGSGSGTPPVVCLSCSGGAHDEWAGVASRLADRTQVITYGRPTLGGSDPLPPAVAEQSVSVGWAAGQLRTLLQRAGIDPPYVLVTSSVGSWIADQYAAGWPGEVAGMVLIDPTMMSPWPKVVEKTTASSTAGTTAVPAGPGRPVSPSSHARCRRHRRAAWWRRRRTGDGSGTRPRRRTSGGTR